MKNKDDEQALENFKLITEDIQTYESKTWKDTVKKVYDVLRPPIRKKEKLHTLKKDIESEKRAILEHEFSPTLDIKNSKKKGILNCKLELEFGHEFKKKDIIVNVSIDGEMFRLISNKGSSTFNMSYGATKRF